ncbi:unnamed protein product, partial [Gongylonema pulchrum]|uniref:LAM_G_DOMAIN domain-containing protein n=1 Tax=Gongylonema pulchrum TaxID=637853 RepID=A0A183EUW1_9BILA
SAAKTTIATSTASAVNVFGFDEVSYAQIHAPIDLYDYLELSFMVKLQLPNGLLYLQPSEHCFFSIYSQNAFLTVHYTTADAHAILSSQHPLSLGAWHRVEVWRSGRAVLLKIDDQPWIEDRIKKSDVEEDELQKSSKAVAYFGGAPTAEISPSLPVRNGLSGCMKKIYHNGRFVDLKRDALATRKMHQCGWDACADVHCQAQAQCMAYRATPYCRCRFPTFGLNCEKRFLEYDLEHQ